MNNDITPEEKNIRVVQNILDTCSSDLAYMRQKAFDRNAKHLTLPKRIDLAHEKLNQAEEALENFVYHPSKVE